MLYEREREAKTAKEPLNLQVEYATDPYITVGAQILKFEHMRQQEREESFHEFYY